MNRIAGKVFLSLRASLAISAAFLCGCSPQPVFEGTIGVDAAPPTYVSARMPTGNRLAVVFSESVKVKALRFNPELPVSATSDGASEVLIDFTQALEPGRRYIMDITAEDPDGNTITVLSPFIGRNDRPPKLVVNEIRTEYSKPKVEYIELFVKGAGQLGGLSVVSTAAGFSEPILVFPPVEVSSGDFIVVHLRSIEDGLVDEIGALDASSGTEASPTARDFWAPGAEKRVRKTDVVAVLDTDGNPLDGVAFTETPGTDWKNEELRTAADFLVGKGAWSGDAALSVGCTATRTLGRKRALLG